MIGRANHRYDYLIFACILGRSLKRRAVLHIAHGHVLRVKSCGKAHTDAVRIEIIGEIKRIEGKAVLGEGCLFDSVGSGGFACVVAADSLDSKSGCACVRDIISFGICKGEVHAHHKLCAHNGDSHHRCL